MRFSARGISIVAFVAALVTAIGLQVGSAPGGIAAAAATWQLVDHEQTTCFSPRKTTSYYGIFIRGTWKRAVDAGIAGLPPGGSFTTSYAPIPPGSSDGEHSLASVGVTLPSDTPVGTYTADLWAKAGRNRQSVPVTLVVKARCGY